MKIKNWVGLIAVTMIGAFATAQNLTYDIRINQLGFLPNAVKIGAVVNTELDSFSVMTKDMNTTVFKGLLLPPQYYSSSGEDVRLADFTLMTIPGEYVLVVDDLGKSVPFKVDSNVFYDLSKAVLKAYYFNRASTPILSEFAGVYAREEGHPDTAVIVLPSAASANRPAGTKISTPGGWYDAGDYNKYIVSSGGTVFTILSAYETYPEFYDTLNLNIPESNNSIPDILDEALWNIKWMMTMQDEDGGVYNKTTEANFSEFKMPSQVTSTRYVTAKGTAATLDFAAVMAMTARIYRKYDQALADTALSQALRAWDWAKKNPNVVFKNPASSGGYPGVNTGEYSDTGFDDEFSWCASELYVTTKDSNYYKEIDFTQSFGVPGWPTVRSLGLLTLLVNKDSLTSIADIDLIKSTLINAVSSTKSNIVSSPYRIPGDFYYWAGNNAFANWGMMFIQAFRATGDASYFNAALVSLDYLLGKNAATYCYVTGFGSKSPMHIHHRISSADGIVDPVPGLLAGGAASGDGADCGASSYPSTFPAKSYLDSECSYSTNEIAIGINAALAFLVGSVHTEYQENFLDSMPSFFSISTNRINVLYKTGNDMPLTVLSNTEWELVPSADWIKVSATSGIGNATVQINSKTDNPTDSTRSGIIYAYSQSKLVDSILIMQNGKRRSFRIEAEDFIDKLGVQTETTGDVGGGLNIGFITKDYWVAYNLEITEPGLYDVTFRHAGYAGNIDVSLNDTFLVTVKFPKTADWQVYDSYTTQIFFKEGQHILKLKFNSEGTNLNWYQFDWKSYTNVDKEYTEKSNSVRIYPNPANDKIFIKSSDFQYTNIEILDLIGRSVFSKTMPYLPENELQFSLPAGQYFLVLSNKEQKKTVILSIVERVF